jgi:hypothetical protein
MAILGQQAAQVPHPWHSASSILERLPCLVSTILGAP